jgi:ketosteroid isomerase-like protein
MLKIFAVRNFAAALLLGAAAVAPAHADPVAVQQQLLDALARGDVTAALDLYTEDAVIDSESGHCTKAPCVGRAAIQKDLERYVADKSRRVTVLNTYVSGNVLVTRFEARRGRAYYSLGNSRDARRQDRLYPMLYAGAHRRADDPLS